MDTPSSATALEDYAPSEGPVFEPRVSQHEPRRFDGDDVGEFDIHELLSALQALQPVVSVLFLSGWVLQMAPASA